MAHRRTTAIDSEFLELSDRKIPKPQKIAHSKQGMVATQHFEATRAGSTILQRGGNAFDAAVASAFALGVCEPAASGLGGQTMLLVRSKRLRRTFAIDGSSRAPNLASPDTLKTKSLRRRGYTATTVPSTPAVLGYVLSRCGTMTLAQVLEPAIELAQRGCVVTPLQHALTQRELKHLRNGTAAPLFLRNGTRPYPAGSVFAQPVLASTLRRLADMGIEDFYTGDIARRIVEDMVAHDGLIGLDDLAQIPWPVERRPITCNFDSMRVFTFPPPGAGRTLIEMLNIFQSLPPSHQRMDTAKGSVAMAKTIRQALVDRRDRPFDPSLFPQADEEKMTSPDYARRVARRIVRPVKSGGETTHLSVMDKEGNAVALTQSIERVYGSFCATPSLGFLYNNYIRSFELEDMAHPYYLRPNAAPWASVAPTIVVRGRKPWLVIGSPGSERIPSAICQVLVRLRKADPLAAVDAPRLHCSLHGKVAIESSRMPDDVVSALEHSGLEVDVRDPYSFYLGCVQLVLRTRDGFIGVADPRRDGSAGGPTT